MGFTVPDSPPPPQGVPQEPVSSFDIQAPYVPGSPQPIAGPEPGGGDIVAGSVQDAVSTAMAWHSAMSAQTYEQGSALGVQPGLPGQDFSVATAHGTGYNGQQ